MKLIILLCDISIPISSYNKMKYLCAIWSISP